MNAENVFLSRSCGQFKQLLLTLVLATAQQHGYTASSDLDPSFDPGSTINQPVNAVIVQPDGKVLAGGSFSTVHGAMSGCLARFDPDGTNDSTFLLGMNLAGNMYYSTPAINRLALQDDGKILIGGSFISTNGVACTNIARLNPDGSVDTSFVAQIAAPDDYDLWGGSVNSIILTGDGRMLVAGGFTAVNGVSCTSIVRLNSNGTLDPTFNVVLGAGFAQPAVNTAALQGDGKILIAGNFNQVNGVPENYLARLNANGSLDDTFTGPMGSNDGGTIQTIICQTNGQILIGGVFSTVSGAAHNGIARLNADGSTDTNFQANAGWVYSLTMQPDGKILAGGEYSNGQMIIRFNSNGSQDGSFLAPAAATSSAKINSVVLQNDGKIMLGGGFQSVRNNLARLNPDGSVDATFCNGPTGPNMAVGLLAVQPDQKIVIGGGFTSIDGVLQGQVARLNADGSLDNSFTQGLPGISGLTCLALQNDGKVLIAGYVYSEYLVARLNPDGSLDTSFRSSGGANSQIYCLSLQGDGKVLVGGAFTSYNGTPCNYLVRLNTNGSPDTSFLQGLTGPNGTVFCTSLQPDGKILIGGYFTSVNGATQNYVARLNPDGSLDGSFFNGLTGPNNLVGGLTIQSDGRILIGGRFTSVNGLAATNVARLFPNGSLDNSFSCSGLPAQFLNFNYASFALQRDGKIVLLERRFPLGPPPRNLFRLNTDGSLDNTFVGVNSSLDGGVRSLAIQADGKLLLCGNFSTVNQTPRSYVARLMGEYAPPAITALPSSATAEAGGGIRFVASATGYPPLVYQWFFNGTNLLSGCTNRCLDLAGIPLNGYGAYTVVISNADGVITSAPVILNVIPQVNRRLVPVLNLFGETGSSLNVECTEELGPSATWLLLDTVSLSGTSQFYCDASSPVPPQRFYRTSQAGTPAAAPSLDLPGMAPAITVTGNIGDSLRLDYINVFGPTNAWVTLDAVTLTNTSQLYFDVSSLGQPGRLYRIVPTP